MQRFRGYAMTMGGTLILAMGISMSGLGGAAAADIKDVVITNDAAHPVPANITNAASNPIPISGGVNVQNTPNVNVQSLPGVKLDPTGNTVQAVQSGTWGVNINGTSNVALSPNGNTVKLDPTGNTVKLDTSSPIPVTVTGAGAQQPTTTFYFNIDHLTPSATSPTDTANMLPGLKFSWASSNSTTIGSGTSGAGAGKVQLGEITIVRPMDSYSPGIFQAMAAGTHELAGTITFLRKDDKGGLAVDHTIKLNDVMVTSVKQNIGDPSQVDEFSSQPLETITLAFARVQIEYPGATPGSTNTGGWDLTTNTAP